MQEQISRGQQFRFQEGLSESLQDDLHKIDTTLSQMDQNMEAQEQSLEVS